jgi:hypothetical protein
MFLNTYFGDSGRKREEYWGSGGCKPIVGEMIGTFGDFQCST